MISGRKVKDKKKPYPYVLSAQIGDQFLFEIDLGEIFNSKMLTEGFPFPPGTVVNYSGPLIGSMNVNGESGQDPAEIAISAAEFRTREWARRESARMNGEDVAPFREVPSEVNPHDLTNKPDHREPGSQLWHDEVIPKFIDPDDDADPNGLSVDIRTDEFWRLIFDKYRLLEAHMIMKRRDEIVRLFDTMINARQVARISDEMYERFVKMEGRRALAASYARPIQDNPQG